MPTLSIHILGLELLCITLTADDAAEEEATELAGGTTSSTPMGFVPSWPDQRWELGAGQGDV